MDLYQKLLKLNEHIYKVLKRIENGENLEEILNDFYEKENQFYNSLSLEEIDSLLDDVLEDKIEEEVSLHIFLHNPKMNRYTKRILFQLLQKKHFYKMQEMTRFTEEQIDLVVNNPYINRIKKNQEDFYKIEYLLFKEFQKKYSMDSFYLKNRYDDENSSFELEILDSPILDSVLIDTSSITYDLLKEKLNKTERNKFLTYLKCLFKVIPSTYHKKMFFEIKNMYDNQKEQEIDTESVQLIESFLNTLNFSLEQQEIDGYSVLYHDDDQFIMPFTNKELKEYSMVYQDIYELSWKMLNTYHQMIDLKIEGKEDEDLFKIYRLYLKKENDILSKVSDYENFTNYISICYHDYHLKTIPYPIIHYTESIIEHKTVKDLEKIEEFLHIRSYYQIMYFNLKEEENEKNTSYVYGGLDMLENLTVEDFFEDFKFIIDYLLGKLDQKEFEKIFLNEKEEVTKEEIEWMDSFVELDYMKKLENLIKQLKDQKEKDFFMKCYYFLIFLDGRTIKETVENHLNYSIKRVDLGVEDEKIFQEYKEYIEECLECLKEYKTKREKQAYELYQKSYKQFLKDNAMYLSKKKEK